MIRANWQFVAACIACGLLAMGPFIATASADSITVVNPGFDLNPSHSASPGYGAVLGWTSNDTARTGMNTSGQAFASGTVIPDFERVGFIQRSTDGDYFSTLSQFISGLDPAKQYWFQIYYNSRQGTGVPPIMHVTYNDQILVDNLSIPQGNLNYTFLNVAFTPGATGGTLAISNHSPTNVDSTILIDAISIIERNPNHVVIANPSFEGSQVRAWPGYTGNLNGSNSPTNTRIAGWISTGRTGIAPLTSTNPPGGDPYQIDNNPFGVGSVNNTPDGAHVVFLQHNSSGGPGAFSSIAQTLGTLVDGGEYELSFYASARNSGNLDPMLTVTLGNHNLFANTIARFTGASTNFDYVHYTIQFTADGSDVNPLLMFAVNSQVGGGDVTVLLDNISLQLIPEPSLFASGALGLLLLAVRKRR